MGMDHVLEQLRSATWVDLTPALHNGIPHSPAFESKSRSIVSAIERGEDGRPTGFLSREHHHVGQGGTHVDPPAHFVPGLRHQDEIPVTEMILLLVVLDIIAQAAADADGVLHYPGWSLEVLVTLFEQHGVVACGHETTDTGVAVSHGDTSRERYALGANHYQVELLANLDELPPTGALIVATWPQALHGSGSPARVFAFYQKD